MLHIWAETILPPYNQWKLRIKITSLESSIRSIDSFLGRNTTNTNISTLRWENLKLFPKLSRSGTPLELKEKKNCIIFTTTISSFTKYNILNQKVLTKVLKRRVSTKRHLTKLHKSQLSSYNIKNKSLKQVLEKDRFVPSTALRKEVLTREACMFLWRLRRFLQ